MKALAAALFLCSGVAAAQALTLARVETTPGLTPAVVQAALQQQLALWPACGFVALPEFADFDGRVMVTFSIDPLGKASQVHVLGPLRGDCVASAISGTAFPRPQWRAPVEVQAFISLAVDKATLDEQRKRFKAELTEWCAAYGKALQAKGADDFSAASAAFASLLRARGLTPPLSLEAFATSTLSWPSRALVMVVGGAAPNLESMQAHVAGMGVPAFCPQK